MAPPAIMHAHFNAQLSRSLVGCSLFFLLALPSCTKHQSPVQSYNHAYQLFLQGHLSECGAHAKREYESYRGPDPALAAKFANLEAECLIWSGLYQDALGIYADKTLAIDAPDSRVFALSMQASAHTHLRHFDDAHERLQQADKLCSGTAFSSCSNVQVAMGMLSIEEGELEKAEKQLTDGLALARNGGDRFTEATAQLDLSVVAIRRRHFDEAADRIAETFRLTDALGAKEIAQNALGNQAWAYYRLGNFTGALELFHEAEQRAASLGDLGDQASWLIGIGIVEFERSQFAKSAAAFQQALQLETKVNNVEDIYTAQVPLAQLALQRGDLPDAEGHLEKAMQLAHTARSRVDELYPILIRGQIAVRRGDLASAAAAFSEVEQDVLSPVYVKWEAQRLLAELAEHEDDAAGADREYRAALTTFENARRQVQKEALQISFLSNGTRIYEGYVHFLIAHGKSNDALHWADYSRARTRAQGLGVLDASGLAEPPPLDAQQIALKSGGTLLFYWLGEKESYLWAVTTRKTELFTLQPGAEIEAAILRYRQTLEVSGSTENSVLTDRDGLWLYGTLVKPAEALISRDGRVFVFADAGLNNLNFETLIVANSQPHFWIDDVSVICSSALSVLARPETAWPPLVPRTLLLIGNSVSPSDKYPSLERAAEQVRVVSGHFPAGRRRVIEQEQATPEAYLAAIPERYSVIHFVAHGTASRASPLDSAIVLSRPSTGNDLYKLYARDIVLHPIAADLVVISACYSAGESAFAGEGLVGLSWAFQRAGARNVIAALGEVSAASAIPLMDQFYEGLGKGLHPDAALRNAKLSLLRGGRFASPFYWAPFQLYGSGRMRT